MKKSKSCTLYRQTSHSILGSDSNKLIWISKYLNLSFEWNIFKQVLNIGCYRSNVRFYFITGHCGSWFEWYFQYSDQSADWMVMRMYLAAIWADNAMEDKFMSISNTFHFDPNCLLIFTGHCWFCLSNFWFTVSVSMKDKYLQCKIFPSKQQITKIVCAVIVLASTNILSEGWVIFNTFPQTGTKFIYSEIPNPTEPALLLSWAGQSDSKFQHHPENLHLNLNNP